MPSATPRTIDKTVSTRVFFAPLITGAEKALSLMNDHWNAGFVTSMCTNIADTSTTPALATHRPGWRTGIALTSARVDAVGVVVSVIVSPDYDVAGGLTWGLLIAPSPTYHASRIFLYVPSLMSALRAPASASAKAMSFLGTT